MARVQTIIVGGGVGAVAPFTEGTIPLISSDDPPAISDSIITQTSAPDIVIGTDPDATATEKVRWSGGAMIAAEFGGVAIADTVSIGKGAGVTTANKTGNITIGAGAVVSHASAASQRNVVIGDDAVFSSSNGSSVVLGATASITGAAQGICIGFGAIISGGSGVCIGNGASVAQTSSVCIGDSAAVASGASNSTAVGGSASAAGNPSTALGNGCSVAASGNGSVAIGLSNSVGAHAGCLLIGRALTSIAANHCQIGGLGPSQDYRTFVLGGGDTEATAPAARTIRFTNATGTNIAAGSVTFTAPRATGNAIGGDFVFRTGAAGASGTTLQSAVVQFSILTAPVGGTGPNTRWDNVVDGAGAGAGTLLNAPSAGDPSFWLPVNINGNVRYIPCWT